MARQAPTAWLFVRDSKDMTLKAIRFPSTHFPSADLRVNSDTQYKFNCASCSCLLAVPFGWLVQPNHTLAATLAPEQIKAVRSQLELIDSRSAEHFELVECSACGISYIIQAKIDETSNNTYRVVVTGVAQVTS